MGGSESKLVRDTVTEEERAAFANKSVLITGANSGLGFDACKQLAECGWGRIVMACRSKERGEQALKELEQLTSKSVFELVVLDVESKTACKDVAKSLSGKLDCLILNAGKVVPEVQAVKPSPDGYSTNMAMHVLGPVTFTDALLSEDKLSKDAVVIYVSSEAARGISAMSIAPPVLPETKEQLEKFAYGEVKALPSGEWDDMAEYGLVKLIGTMHFAGLARQQPNLTVFSVSPGNTRGTKAVSEKPVLGTIAPALMAVLGVFGMSHSLETGTDRYIQLAARPVSFKSGGFYASVSSVPTGPMGPQSTHHAVLDDEAKQDMVMNTLLGLARATGRPAA